MASSVPAPAPAPGRPTTDAVPTPRPLLVAFLVSDLLLGLGVADLDIPASGVLVMTTYALAQYLIVTGWVLAVRATVRPGGAS